MIPINKKNLKKLALAHADNVLAFYQGFHRGRTLPQIDTWISTNLGSGKTFKSVLSADTQELEFLVAEFTKKRRPAFNSAILTIKSQYTAFRSASTSNYKDAQGIAYNGYAFAANLGLTVCPYCNRNYIYNIPDSRRTTCELDHFYDKAAFPFLALSFYNLIPSCKTCNHLKSNAPGTYYNLHRTDLSETDILEFHCKIMGSSFLDDTQDLQMDYTIHPDFQHTFDQLKIKELYSKHLDLVQDIIKKRIIYDSGYIDQLYQNYGGMVFNSREEVVNALLSGYLQEDQIHMRPFSKLTKHIWEQLAFLDQ